MGVCCGKSEQEREKEQRDSRRESNARQEEELVASSESIAVTVTILNSSNTRVGEIKDQVKSKSRVRAFLRKCATENAGDCAKVDVPISEAHLLRLRLVPKDGLKLDDAGCVQGGISDWITLDIDARFEEFEEQGFVSVLLPQHREIWVSGECICVVCQGAMLCLDGIEEIKSSQGGKTLDRRATAVIVQEMTDEDYRAMFDHYDKDGDNYLTEQELGAVLRNCNTDGVEGTTDADIAAMFKDLDTDNDGKICFEEFCAGFREAGLK